MRLHVVQISRDAGLLRPSFDSEPVQRQLALSGVVSAELRPSPDTLKEWI